MSQSRNRHRGTRPRSEWDAVAQVVGDSQPIGELGVAVGAVGGSIVAAGDDQVSSSKRLSLISDPAFLH